MQTIACIGVRERFSGVHWCVGKPCGPVWTSSWGVMCAQWQMSCCNGPNWEVEQRGERSGNGKKARMLGESDTEHPQSKAGHKTQGVYFPLRQAGALFFFYSVPESSRLIGGSSHRIAESWWQTCGLMLSPSLSLTHTYTRQNVSADTIQEEGGTDWGEAGCQWARTQMVNKETIK